MGMEQMNHSEAYASSGMEHMRQAVEKYGAKSIE
jgi:hypothetical protein